ETPFEIGQIKGTAMPRVVLPLERSLTREPTGACRGRTALDGASWPLFRIDRMGEPKLLGYLHGSAGDQYWLERPLGECARRSAGLPFFLHDLIPQGFLGRGIPRRFPELALPEDIAEWNDEHVLTYLSRRGDDCIGDLVLGDESLQRWLAPERTESREPDY